jgi:hypothetical protein
LPWSNHDSKGPLIPPIHSQTIPNPAQHLCRSRSTRRRSPRLPQLRHFIPSVALSPFLLHSLHPHQVDRHRPRPAHGSRDAAWEPWHRARLVRRCSARGAAELAWPRHSYAEAVRSVVFTPARGTVPATRACRWPRGEPWRSFFRPSHAAALEFACSLTADGVSATAGYSAVDGQDRNSLNLTKSATYALPAY